MNFTRPPRRNMRKQDHRANVREQAQSHNLQKQGQSHNLQKEQSQHGSAVGAVKALCIWSGTAIVGVVVARAIIVRS